MQSIIRACAHGSVSKSHETVQLYHPCLPAVPQISPICQPKQLGSNGFEVRESYVDNFPGTQSIKTLELVHYEPCVLGSSLFFYVGTLLSVRTARIDNTSTINAQVQNGFHLELHGIKHVIANIAHFRGWEVVLARAKL